MESGGSTEMEKNGVERQCTRIERLKDRKGFARYRFSMRKGSSKVTNTVQVRNTKSKAL